MELKQEEGRGDDLSGQAGLQSHKSHGLMLACAFFFLRVIYFI